METEVKLPFPDAASAREALRRAGATERSPRQFEDNRLYDDDARALKAAGKVLRLRSTGGRHLVTYKAPDPSSEGSRYKVRVEHETEVGDAEAFDRLLRGLGYRPLWRYQKYRQGFDLPGVHAELDETPIGVFVELEGEGDAIDAAAARLGLGHAAYVTRSYRELQEDATGSREPGDLVFDPDAP